MERWAAANAGWVERARSHPDEAPTTNLAWEDFHNPKGHMEGGGGERQLGTSTLEDQQEEEPVGPLDASEAQAEEVDSLMSEVLAAADPGPHGEV